MQDNTQDQANDTNASAINSDIIFKIQIASSQQKIKNKTKTFKKCTKIKGYTQVDELAVGNSYKYTLGNSTNYQEIVEFNKAVRKVYSKAFIIALQNGKIIPLNDALER